MRKAFKDFAGFPVGDFNKLTGAGSGENGDGKQGRPVEWDDPKPWSEAVDGAALLTDIADFITRYVSLPAELADTATLWIPVTWIHDSLLDRSIVLRLERRPPNVSLASWRDRDKATVAGMRRKLARWIADSEANIVAGLSAVEFPSGLHERARDAWETLLAIANAAGGEWAGPGGRARRACERVMASTAGEEAGAHETLLADLRAIFEAESWPAALGSKAILDKLTAMEGRPWGEWSGGKPLSAHRLSKLLKPFGIAPRNMRINGTVVKGYERTAFEHDWIAYFPESPGSQTATSLQPHEISDFRDSQSATHAGTRTPARPSRAMPVSPSTSPTWTARPRSARS